MVIILSEKKALLLMAVLWENELSSTTELSSTRGQNSRLPKTEVFGGTELLSTTELWTTRGGQNFRLPLNSCLQCLPKVDKSSVLCRQEFSNVENKV